MWIQKARTEIALKTDEEHKAALWNVQEHYEALLHEAYAQVEDDQAKHIAAEEARIAAEIKSKEGMRGARREAVVCCKDGKVQ